MERLFIDTNVILDLLGEREPFYVAAAKIATLADIGQIRIVTSALSYANTFYILSKYYGKLTANDKIKRFKVLSITAELTDKVIDQALVSKFGDFEDALQYYSALTAKSHLIITRNVKDFKAAQIPVMTPNEYLKRRMNKT